MAIIKCPECGMNVSDKSNMCIHCGYPIAKSQLKKVVRFLPNENKYIIEKDNLTQSEAEQYAKEFNNKFLKYNFYFNKNYYIMYCHCLMRQFLHVIKYFFHLGYFIFICFNNCKLIISNEQHI